MFAGAEIAAGTVLETCPVLILGSDENREHIEKTSLYHYTYNWPSQGRSTQAVVFGLGSLFNHSRVQNVGWIRDVEKEVVVYHTLRDIAKGEELCISYGDRLTFVDADGPACAEVEDDLDALGRIEVDLGCK